MEEVRYEYSKSKVEIWERGMRENYSRGMGEVRMSYGRRMGELWRKYGRGMR